MKSGYAIWFLLLMLLPTTAKAQDITVKADYPEVVRSGQQFQVSWTVNSGDGEFVAPSFSGFYKLMGPQTSYSSSTQIINGKISRETSYSYIYYLQAVREGKYVIPPASVVIKNKTYSSDSLRIEVIGNNAVSQRNAQAPEKTNIEPQEVPEDNIFLGFTVDKREAYVGEAIVATLKLYTRVDLSGISEIKLPGFEGLLRTDLNTPPLTSLKRENINGTIYGTGVVQQFLLYPQLPGEIAIDPVQITVLVQKKTGNSDPFFGDFFSTFSTVPQAVVSKAITLKVNPLPGTKPEDFSGIVGKAGISASLTTDSINVNDAINLKFVISGSGNLKLANAPKLKLPADLESYDPKITDDLKNGINGTTGQKTFDYLLIPRHYGEFTIPPVSYSYFNVATKQYDRVTTPELHFYARRGAEQSQGTGATVYGGVSKEEVKYLGKDIRFIKNDSGSLRETGNYISSKRSFYSAYIFALALFIGVLIVRREHIRRNADLTSVRNRKAAKVAGKRLKVAGLFLKNGPADKFYEEILKAIWGYLSDKLNIPVSDLTRVNAVDALRGRGIAEEEINNLISILDKCEFTRFAPSSSEGEASKIYDGASRFIRTVENAIG
jgi:BatD DUF11 like domain